MNPHVNLESGGRCTLLGAELARPLVLPSVHQNVIVVLGLFRKPKGTEFTLEGLFLCMVGSHVPFYASLVNAGVITEGTLEGFVTLVDVGMISHGSNVFAEQLATYKTHVLAHIITFPESVRAPAFNSIFISFPVVEDPT